MKKTEIYIRIIKYKKTFSDRLHEIGRDRIVRFFQTDQIILTNQAGMNLPHCWLCLGLDTIGAIGEDFFSLEEAGRSDSS